MITTPITIANGAFDYCGNKPHDTFTVGDRTLDAAQFGSYIAGYAGYYYGGGGGFGGRVGFALVLAGGVWHDFRDSPHGNQKFDFDADSVIDIHNGAVRARKEANGGRSNCGCGF